MALRSTVLLFLLWLTDGIRLEETESVEHPPDEVLKRLELCVSSQAKVTCEAGATIRIHSAFYNIKARQGCAPGPAGGLESCHTNFTHRLLPCDGARECIVPNSAFFSCAEKPFTGVKIMWTCDAPALPKLPEEAVEEEEQQRAVAQSAAAEEDLDLFHAAQEAAKLADEDPASAPSPRRPQRPVPVAAEPAAKPEAEEAAAPEVAAAPAPPPKKAKSAGAKEEGVQVEWMDKQKRRKEAKKTGQVGKKNNKRVCVTDDLVMSCPDGAVIDLFSAFYLRKKRGCGPEPTELKNCETNVTEHVRQVCGKEKQKCTLAPKDNWFCDEKPFNSIRAVWNCV